MRLLHLVRNDLPFNFRLFLPIPITKRKPRTGLRGFDLWYPVPKHRVCLCRLNVRFL